MQDSNKIGVLRLHRLGDILQSIPVLHNIKSNYPNAHLSLITSPSFSYVLEQIPHMDELILIDTKVLSSLSIDDLLAIDVKAEPDKLPPALNILRQSKFDLLINLHADPFAAWLTQHAYAARNRGRKLLADGCMELRGKWQFYFATCVRNRTLAITNIVDIWTLLSGAKPLPSVSHRLQTSFDAKDMLGLKHNRINIALQPGSADPFRRWPPEFFVQFAQGIAKHIPARFILIGSEAEKDLCQTIATSIDAETINAAGYDLLETAKILNCTKLLLTGDTGPMHLAAILGVRILALYFGRTLPNETGAYTHQAISLVGPLPKDLPTHADNGQDPNSPQQLLPEFAMNAALWSLKTNLRELDIQQTPLQFLGGLPGSRAYVGQFNPAIGKFEQHVLHCETATLAETKEILCAGLFFRYWLHLPEWDDINPSEQTVLLRIDFDFERSEVLRFAVRLLGPISPELLAQASQELMVELAEIEKTILGQNNLEAILKNTAIGSFAFLLDLKRILTSTSLLAHQPIPIDSIINNFIDVSRKVLNHL